MGDDGRSQMGYRQRSGESMVNSPSSNMNARPMIMHPGSTSGWDPMVSIGRNGNFGAASTITRAETQEFSGSSHLVNCSSDPSLAQLLPMSSMFESGNIHELVNPFGLPLSPHNPNTLFQRNHASTNSRIDEKSSPHAAQADRIVGVSPNGKRNRDSEHNSSVTKTVGGNPQKGHSCETLGSKEQDDKRQKSEQNTAANSSGKQTSKQVEDNSQGEEASKKDYIHVRARRGQATNSHSLAERVRREKISERMRLLQDLVPGCNKITGKAVMLDEIINYVQSLQQQVEFLSMKLSTVNPELNFDIDRLMSKDMLQSQGSGPPILGFDQGMNSSHGFPLGIHQTLTTMPNTVPHYHHMPQAVWDGDLQSLLQMGFDSNAALGGNGSSKNEL